MIPDSQQLQQNLVSALSAPQLLILMNYVGNAKFWYKHQRKNIIIHSTNTKGKT